MPLGNTCASNIHVRMWLYEWGDCGGLSDTGKDIRVPNYFNENFDDEGEATASQKNSYILKQVLSLEPTCISIALLSSYRDSSFSFVQVIEMKCFEVRNESHLILYLLIYNLF